VREEVLKVDFGVFFEIADGIFESLVVRSSTQQKFSPQAVRDSKNITMGVAVSGVISGDVDPDSIEFGQENHGKGDELPLFRTATDTKFEPLHGNDPLFRRHRSL
jgi:hypothetical protein